jgi:hypothetical protein
LNGRAINVMISPLPRNKRARHPSQLDGAPPPTQQRSETNHQPASPPTERHSKTEAPKSAGGFSNNPFAELEVKH